MTERRIHTFCAAITAGFTAHDAMTGAASPTLIAVGIAGAIFSALCAVRP